MTAPARPRTALPGRRPGIAAIGDHEAVLLSGPAESTGTEALPDHLRRLGALSTHPDRLWEQIRISDLRGRGGAGFPLAEKIRTVLASRSTGGPGAVVVVNASESEPASRKDATLLQYRPHLVLDGAVACARIVEAAEVVIRVHRSAAASVERLGAALAERDPRQDGFPIRVATGPSRFVSGESSAVVRHLDGGDARPRTRRQPVAASGVRGAPTLLANAETMAHVALLVRMGAAAWRARGSSASGVSGGIALRDGSRLITLAGAVARPGLVVELTSPVRGADLLGAAAGIMAAPAAVLVGGFAGTWVRGPDFWHATWGAAPDSGLGYDGQPDLGCGVVTVLASAACGIAESASLLRWLSQESAGQCGPCRFGLPDLAATMDRLVRGRVPRRERRRFEHRLEVIGGRGACRHPDGVIGMVASMFSCFSADVASHAAGVPCPAAGSPVHLEVPDLGGGWR